MASNKTYTIVKDGEELKELKTLAAAKKLADAECADVLCEGECVYQGTVTGAEDTVTDTVAKIAAEAPAKTPKPEKYTLTSRMNIRKAPSKDADKLGIAEKGTVVEVAAIKDDWMHLTAGTFILYDSGKFSVKC